jgi:hypothetical protein
MFRVERFGRVLLLVEDPFVVADPYVVADPLVVADIYSPSQ